MTDRPDTRLARRDLLKRSALVGSAVLWTTPVVQSIGGAALATVGTGCACLTGGSGRKAFPGTYKGVNGEVTIGLGKICCGSAKAQIEVNFHPTDAPKPKKKAVLVDESWHFTEVITLSCTHTGDPSPPKKTADGPNRFMGTASDGVNILSFDLTDNGEGMPKDDTVTISIAGPQGPLAASGTVTGNWQAHKEKDC